MEFIKLNNGMEMPILGFGTYQNRDPEECTRTVKEAISLGYRLIDTAQMYFNEEAVGKAIAECGVDRKELFITTKVFYKRHEYDECRKSLLESIEKLRCDYLDLVLIHWPYGNYYAAWRAMEDLVKEGKIRAIGVSNFNPDRLIDLIGFNEIKPVIDQVETNLYRQNGVFRKWFDEYGVVCEAYAPLGQARSPKMFEEPLIIELANKYKKTKAQIMLRFLTQEKIVIIPKSVHYERIKENIEIFDFKLTEEEIEGLRKLDQNQIIIGNPETPERVVKQLNR
ncbi:MAG: aldo/keto reductase [Gammaproteobacteria bacterium]|nr:aldo/keto reductase [Gammaproteobacteria bacterium]